MNTAEPIWNPITNRAKQFTIKVTDKIEEKEREGTWNGSLFWTFVPPVAFIFLLLFMLVA